MGGGNIEEKEEIARNEQFLLFPQRVFLFYLISNYPSIFTRSEIVVCKLCQV